MVARNHFFIMLDDEFADVDLNSLIDDENDLDIERFDFLDVSHWDELVEPHMASGTLRKLKFCEALFNSWKTKRNQANPFQVPEKSFVDYTIDEMNM